MKPLREVLKVDLPVVEKGDNDPCVRCPHTPVDPRVLRCEHRKRYPGGRCSLVEAYLAHERQVLLGRGVPLRALEVLRAKMRRTEALDVARRHFQEIRRGRWLVLSGPTGSGKTVAAVFVLLWMFRTGVRDVRFVPAYEFDGSGEISRFLVLDDLGLETREWPVVREIYRRYDRVFPMVITTNLPLSRLRSRYGERVYSRIREVGIGYELAEGDIRKGNPDGAGL
ncbi:MAG: hypothetical protein L3J76_01225 [Candidatus Hydrothermae bacterium]|nr:hypothetical protein [Candidatus Hydrothermae bacterium]